MAFWILFLGRNKYPQRKKTADTQILTPSHMATW